MTQGRLTRLVSGRQERPVRVVLYSVDGLGKSTWAADAPAPLFIGAEDGTSQLDVDRLPDINAWTDILDSLHELTVSGHKFQTVVLDTADWAEAMLWAYLAKRDGKKSIEDYGYGKGYVAALDEWRVLVSALDRLRDAKGMNVIVLCHSWIKAFKNPEGDDFDRYEMKLHAKASGLLKEWADVVLFGTYETFAIKADAKAKAKGLSSGARVVYTQRTAAYDAKNRYSLPEQLPLSWSAFAEAVKARRTMPTVDTRERIAGLLAGQPDALAERVNKAVADAGEDAQKLAKILNHLAVTVAPKEKAS